MEIQAVEYYLALKKLQANDPHSILDGSQKVYSQRKESVSKAAYWLISFI